MNEIDWSEHETGRVRNMASRPSTLVVRYTALFARSGILMTISGASQWREPVD